MMIRERESSIIWIRSVTLFHHRLIYFLVSVPDARRRKTNGKTSWLVDDDVRFLSKSFSWSGWRRWIYLIVSSSTVLLLGIATHGATSYLAVFNVIHVGLLLMSTNQLTVKAVWVLVKNIFLFFSFLIFFLPLYIFLCAVKRSNRHRLIRRNQQSRPSRVEI